MGKLEEHIHSANLREIRGTNPLSKLEEQIHSANLRNKSTRSHLREIRGTISLSKLEKQTSSAILGLKRRKSTYNAVHMYVNLFDMCVKHDAPQESWSFGKSMSRPGHVQRDLMPLDSDVYIQLRCAHVPPPCLSLDVCLYGQT